MNPVTRSSRPFFASTWDQLRSPRPLPRRLGIDWLNIIFLDTQRKQMCSFEALLDKGFFNFVFAMLVFTQISRNDHRMENAKIKLIINGSAGARSVMNLEGVREVKMC